MKSKHIKLPIYYGTLTIIHCDSWNELEYYNVPFVDEQIEQFCYKKIEHEYYLCFKTKNVAAMSHEIVHLVNFIYLDHNIKKSRKNDEHEAYLFSWLFKKVFKFLKEKE